MSDIMLKILEKNSKIIFPLTFINNAIEIISRRIDEILCKAKDLIPNFPGERNKKYAMIAIFKNIINTTFK
ncbi:hypothetical protein OfM1_16070 [Lactovum odontotermitis]